MPFSLIILMAANLNWNSVATGFALFVEAIIKWNLTGIIEKERLVLMVLVIQRSRAGSVILKSLYSY